MTAAAVVIGILVAALIFCLAGAWALYTLYEHALQALHHAYRKARR